MGFKQFRPCIIIEFIEIKDYVNISLDIESTIRFLICGI